MKIWLGANSNDDEVSRSDLDIIPLNRNITDGITESASALKIPSFLKQKIQTARYSITKAVSIIRYRANASSERQPSHVPGIFIIMVTIQPILPACSAISAGLFLKLFRKPSLYFMANIILGIKITEINIKPKMLNHSILPSEKILCAVQCLHSNQVTEPTVEKLHLKVGVEPMLPILHNGKWGTDLLCKIGHTFP